MEKLPELDITVAAITRRWDDERQQYIYEVDVGALEEEWAVGFLMKAVTMVQHDVQIATGDGIAIRCRSSDCGECETCVAAVGVDEDDDP